MFTRLARVLLALPLLVVVVQAAPDGQPTKLLRSPTVSATHIAFVYANNIWMVERAGGRARRLTSFQGQTTNPHFSPDGKWIAFSGDYAGNTDVYVVPAEGGEPKRLTWHPGADSVQGWTPDGKAIMFASVARDVGAERRAALLDGAGRGRRRGADGAAARLSGEDLARRHPHRLPDEQLVGRGAAQLPGRPEPADLDRRSRRPTTSSRRRGPTRRTWSPSGSATTVYFISDRDGVANVWSYDVEARRSSRRSTKFDDFDVKSMDAGAGASCSSRPAYIHELDPKSGRDARREHHRGRRLPLDDAALGGRDEPDVEHRAVADRQARASSRRAARSSRSRPRRATSGT